MNSPSHFTTAIGASLIACALGCGGESYKASARTTAEFGSKSAKGDLHDGILRIRQPPLPLPHWWSRYRSVLAREAKIEIEVIVDARGGELSDADRAYNRIMVAKIHEVYGPEFLTNVARAVRFDEPMPEIPERPRELTPSAFQSAPPDFGAPYGPSGAIP
ncbi:MAG: hypothetical protein QGG36_26760 [Pirellulaceae bacterium]|jgi:hypothetical protein|nr:hypothetical protein [Pirellulaceae bacterium]MDP7019427.1 hypothetical protein [Pirellulaceae bacterium]